MQKYQNRYRQALLRKTERMRLQYEKCMSRRAFTGALQKIQEQYMLVDKNEKKLEFYIKQKLEKEKATAQNLILKIDALSPLKTLARGYGIISTKGKIVKSVTQLTKGDRVQIRLQDGETKAQII